MSYDDEEFIDDSKSRSQIKREAEALQALGVALIELKPSELEKIPLSDALREAIAVAQKINARGAIRRQRQYIGKLMRQEDADTIQQAYDHLQQQSQEDTARFHLLERLRDKLIAQGDEALDEVLQHYPHADRGQIRQLSRNAKSEQDKAAPPKSARKLFKYLRSLDEGET